ncbi:calponiny domain-containing protein [Biomphalaria glabrata]|nr:calponin homology domain-containing protein [Biomphalaria glabrata]
MASSSYVDLKEVKEAAMQDGKAIELKGKDLAAYVQQIVKEEMERQDKRRREKEEIERQKEEKRQEIERLDRIRREDQERQDIEREKAREHETKMEKMRLEAVQATTQASAQTAQTTQGNNTNNSNNVTTQRDNPNSQTWLKRKIQRFDEQKDDIGDFLKRYEAKMSTFNMPEEEWSEIPIDFVHGQALTICQNHDHHIDDSYQVLKRELLNAYGHNATTFRKKYFDNIPSLEIEPQTTINMEKDFFNKWVQLEKVGNSYEGLKFFILLDNFINKCDPQLQSFIKERNPKCLAEVTEIMRIYKNAYPTNPFSTKDKNKVDLIGYTSEKKVRSNDRHSRETEDRFENRNRDRNGRSKSRDNHYEEITCFNCHKKGHIASHCKKSTYYKANERNSYRDRIKTEVVVNIEIGIKQAEFTILMKIRIEIIVMRIVILNN